MKLDPATKARMIKSIAESVASLILSDQVIDTVFNEFDAVDGTVCEELLGVLEGFGIPSHILEEALEIDPGDMDGFRGWIADCVSEANL